MIGRNIRVFRKKNKLSQEALAEKLDVSRQTIAKWENNLALPDIEKSRMLADIFQVTLDQLSRNMTEEEVKQTGPPGKQFFGVVKVGEKGQIVIPKEARHLYQIQSGDKLIVLGDDFIKGLAILKMEDLLEFTDMIRNSKQEGVPEDV